MIIDGLSRKAIVGYSISKSLDAKLTLSALKMAIFMQGGRYRNASITQIKAFNMPLGDYVDLLKEHKFQISMACKGNPFDNAMAESFIKTLKYEEVSLWDYRTLADVLKRIPFFIQEVYNKKRLHSPLGYLPPDEFESNFIEKEQNLKSCQLVTV